MIERAEPVDRLGIPAFPWWNEALHGVARTGRATVFPQAIGLAATWDTDLMHRVATAISDEARAMNRDWVSRGKRNLYQGLVFWSPNINIFRDPRWGRGQETYGEDPVLTGQMGVAFVTGMQGDDPRYLKTVATPKHYAVHNGPEPSRHVFDARPSELDLYDTYLPAFRATVVEGRAESVMCAYNRLRGDPACGSTFLLQDVLRDGWGFGGLRRLRLRGGAGHLPQPQGSATPRPPAPPWPSGRAPTSSAGAAPGRRGRPTPSSPSRRRWSRAWSRRQDLDRALRRLFRAQMRLGVYDPPGRLPWSGLTVAEVVDSPGAPGARAGGRAKVDRPAQERRRDPPPREGPGDGRGDRRQRRRRRGPPRQLQRHPGGAGVAPGRNRGEGGPRNDGDLRPGRPAGGRRPRPPAGAGVGAVHHPCGRAGERALRGLLRGPLRRGAGLHPRRPGHRLRLGGRRAQRGPGRRRLQRALDRRDRAPDHRLVHPRRALRHHVPALGRRPADRHRRPGATTSPPWSPGG